MNGLAALQKRPKIKLAATGLVVLVMAITCIAGGYATIQRNDAFAKSAAPYDTLATRLRQALPQVPPGSRIVIHDSVWNFFWVWPQVTVQAEYRDPTLTVVSVPPRLGSPPPKPGDIDVYYIQATGSFSTAAPSALH